MMPLAIARENAALERWWAARCNIGRDMRPDDTKAYEFEHIRKSIRAGVIDINEFETREGCGCGP